MRMGGGGSPCPRVRGLAVSRPKRLTTGVQIRMIGIHPRKRVATLLTNIRSAAGWRRSERESDHSVMAIRRGFVIVTCPLPLSGLRGLPRVGQSGLRQAFDDLDELVPAVAVLAGWPYQFPGPGEHGAALRGPGDGGAVAAPELQQSFVAEQSQGSEDGVAVHPGHGDQVAGGREPLAG